MERTLSTRITVQGKTPTTGAATIVELTEDAKKARARKASGLCVAIAVGSLFIPIVHFVLPWLMLIVAVVVHGKVMKQGAILLSAIGPCPACGEELRVDEQTLEWPIEWNCTACRKRTLTTPADLDPAEQAQAAP